MGSAYGTHDLEFDFQEPIASPTMASHGRSERYRPRLRPMISFMISVVPP
jgi:hypothetical protein